MPFIARRTAQRHAHGERVAGRRLDRKVGQRRAARDDQRRGRRSGLHGRRAGRGTARRRRARHRRRRRHVPALRNAARLEDHGVGIRRTGRHDAMARAACAGDRDRRDRHFRRAADRDVDRVDGRTGRAPRRRERGAQPRERELQAVGRVVRARHQRHRAAHGDDRARAVGAHVERADARLQHGVERVGDGLDVECARERVERQHDVGTVGIRRERRLRAHAGDRVRRVAEREDDRAPVLRGDDGVALSGLIRHRRAEAVEKTAHPGVARRDREIALRRDRTLEDQPRALEPQARRTFLRARTRRASEERREQRDETKNSNERAVHPARGDLREASRHGRRRSAPSPP